MARKQICAVLLTLALELFSCLNIAITGEFTFDVKIENVGGRDKLVEDFYQAKARNGEDGMEKILLKNMTAAPVVVCQYQYPDPKQIQAILSNMMNELTKVFLRAHAFFRNDNQRRSDKRFKIVQSKNSTYFDEIFSNMTQEFNQSIESSQFYNNTSLSVSRARDPCQNQDQLRETWRQLLETSLDSLRRAASRCVEELLRDQHKTGDKRTRHNLEQFLKKELERIRKSQLDMLCDNFQLCYNELL